MICSEILYYCISFDKFKLIRCELQWSDECEESFQKLKTMSTSAPVLTLPEKGVESFVYYNDSKFRLVF